MGQDARLPTSPEANPAVVPDRCLMASTSLGLSQSCWDPHGLGESHPLPRVWAASWLRPGCWASLSRLLSLEVWVGWKVTDGKPLTATFPTQSLQDIIPFLEHFQCRMKCWLCDRRGLQNAAWQEEMLWVLGGFLV